jgi:hypothetical protein
MTSDSSRRNFLVMSGAGAAVAGVAVALPVAAVASEKALHLPENAQPLLVHIPDPTSGMLSLLVGEREIVVHDRDLVARIAHAAGGN